MCGGFHFNSKKVCLISSILLLSLVPIIYDFLSFDKFSSRLLLVLMSIFIILKAPVDHINKPITKEQQPFFKRKVILRVGILTIIELIGLLFNSQYVRYIGLSIVCNGLSILITLILRKKGEKNYEIFNKFC